jgi:hypothetical protein
MWLEQFLDKQYDSYTHCKQHHEICIMSGLKTTKIFIAPLCIYNLMFGVLHINKNNHMIQRHFTQVSKFPFHIYNL